MSITTEEDLENLRKRVTDALIRDTREALQILLKALPLKSAKHGEVVKLLGRESYLAARSIDNTLSFEQLDVARNDLRADVLLFTRRLCPADFSDRPPVHPRLRPGHLLYRIPQKMQFRRQYECIIRIADNMEELTRGLDLDEEHNTEPIGLSEVMHVELIDPSPPDGRAFDIVLISTPEQYVDRFSYTEWCFFVRPLRKGRHVLQAKISVLIDVGGKERRKDLRVRREVTVEVEAAEEEVPFTVLRDPAPGTPEEIDDPFAVPPSPRLTRHERSSGKETSRADTGSDPFGYDSPEAPAPAPPPPAASAPTARPKRKSSRTVLRIAASVAILILATVFVLRESDSVDYMDPGDVTSPAPIPDENSNEEPYFPAPRPDTSRSPDTLRLRNR